MEELKLKISDIQFVKEIYPRQQQSQKTVEAYTEALKAGATFPPLVVQKIQQGDDVTFVLLDGKHRLEAYRTLFTRSEKGKNDGSVICELYKEEVMNLQKDLQELRLESAFRNIAHGNRLDMKDREFQARRIVEINPKIENALLAEKFSVEPQTISTWVSDIRARFYASRDAQIYRLSLIGWTQEEIGQLFGVKQHTISPIIGSLSQVKTVIMDAFFKEKKSITEICSYFQIDEVLAWALILDGKSDLERLD